MDPVVCTRDEIGGQTQVPWTADLHFRAPGTAQFEATVLVLIGEPDSDPGNNTARGFVTVGAGGGGGDPPPPPPRPLHDAEAVRIAGDGGNNLPLYQRCATNVVTDCQLTQDHRLVVRNNSTHDEVILTHYRIRIAGGCTVNGIAPPPAGDILGPIIAFSDQSTYARDEQKVFQVRLLFSCPARHEQLLTGGQVSFELDVDHGGDDFPLGNLDGDDDVPANNTVIKRKTLR
jgi:hypothetical protein